MYPKNLNKLINKYKINYFGGAPIQAEWILGSNHKKISLKKIISSGDFLKENVIKLYLKKEKKIYLYNIYGITEVGGRVFDPFGLTNVVSAFEPDGNLDLMPNDSSVVTIIDFNYETDANGDLMPRASSLI